MIPSANPPITSRRRDRVYVGLAVGLGCLFWLTQFTDYSLPGTWPDLLLPPVLMIVGLRAWWVSRPSPARWLRRLAIVPALFGGCLTTSLEILAFVPPFTLGVLFFLSETAGEEQIQEAISPDGTRVAHVYYYGAGSSIATTYKRIAVRVSYRWFPLLERDVWSDRTVTPDRDYVAWQGNDSLYITKYNATIPLGLAQIHWPPVFTGPIQAAGVLLQQFQQQQKTAIETRPLQDVPLYPARLGGDQSSVDMMNQASATEENLFRSFNVPDHTADEVAAWYKTALNTPPWSVVQMDQQVKHDLDIGDIHATCIQVDRDLGNGQRRRYYWEVFGGPTAGKFGPHVNIGTPHPLTEYCKDYVTP